MKPYKREDFEGLPATYCVMDSNTIDDSMHIPMAEYEYLRDALRENLFTFFHVVSCREDDSSPYVQFLGKIINKGAVWPYSEEYLAMNVFYIPEWIGYLRDNIFDEKMKERFVVIKIQHRHTLPR